MKKPTLLYATNNANDWVLLVYDDLVVSHWTVDETVLEDFLRDGSDPSSWADQGADHWLAEDYGQVIAKNGVALPGCEAEFAARVEFFKGEPKE